MRRREFIKLIAGAAAAWPIAARAQGVERVRRIALFPLAAENDPEAQNYVSAFRESLAKLGWLDGQNIRIDIRWQSGEAGPMQADVVGALGLNPDVIVCGGTEVLTELRRRTNTTPIVFVNVGDALAAGLVQNLAHPGGNVTGFTSVESSIGGKWVELLKEIAPRVDHVLLLFNPQNPTWQFHVPAIEAAARSLGIQPTTARVNNAAEIEPAIGAFEGKPNAGMIVLTGLFVQAHRELIITLAAKYRLPAVYQNPVYVSSGGLMSYGIDRVGQYRQAASYVDRIFRGARPGDLPIQQPTKFELKINLKTAKALGLDVPWFLQQRADEVIE
jgi:putative tryptophan/tyrosine transport system substrate-binding protein